MTGRRRRLFGIWALQSLALLAIVGAVGLFALLGRPVDLPQWVVSRIEQTVNQRIQKFDLALGEVSIVVEDNWNPRIYVRDVEVSEVGSSSRIDLEEVHTTLSVSNLIQGRIAPREIVVSGLFLNMRRLQDGSFDLALGEGGQAVNPINRTAQIQDVGRIVEDILDRPAFAELDRLSMDALALRYEDVRAGRGWTVDGGLARMEREGDFVRLHAQFSVLGQRSYASTVDVSFETSYGSEESRFGMSFESLPSGDIASQSPAVTWLNVFKAPISGSLRMSTDVTGRLGPTHVSLEIGEGVLQPNENVRPIPIESAHTFLSYDPATLTLALEDFALNSKLLKAEAAGKAVLAKLVEGRPEEMLVQMNLSKLELNPKDLADVPIALDDSFIDFRLRLNPFEVSLGQLVLRQDGHRLLLNGELATDGENWVYSLDGHMNSVEPDRLIGIWPDRVKTKLRKWIVDNIHSVQLSDINLAVRSRVDAPPDVYADFQFKDLDLRFMKTMPPIKGGAGYATLIRNQFIVGAERGVIRAQEGGEVQIQNTGFTVTDTRIKKSPAIVRIVGQAPVKAVLSLLNRKPLEIMTKANLPVDVGSGWVKATGFLNLVLKDKILPEDVKFDISGTVSDAKSTHFLKDKVISGDLTVHATDERVELGGPGFVGDLPVEAAWSLPIGRKNDGTSTLTGWAELSARTLTEFNVGLPKGTVTGLGRGSFVIDFVKGTAPRMAITTDFTGVGLSFPPLAWEKPAKTAASGTLDLTLAEAPVIDGFSIKAPGLKADGRIELAPDGGLGRLVMDSLSVSDWLTGTGELRGRGAGVAPEVIVHNGSLDMRRMPPQVGGSSGNPSDSGIGPASVTLDRVQVTDTISLRGFKGDFVNTGGLKGRFTALLNGSAPVRGQLLPQSGRTAVRAQSDRADLVLTALGVVPSASRGTLDFRLDPTAKAGEYDGTFEIKNIKIKEAPAIAELLNAISIVGLIEQLSGPGILFTDVASRFRLTPSQIILAQGSAVGPAMGLSMDGYYNFANSMLDMQGAISPIYMVNLVGQPIAARKGEGLIAFNYNLSGPIDDMKVSVNPLSALTPGFFREIFRRPAPKLEK